MDAVTFINESKRMCREIPHCTDCPMYRSDGLVSACGMNRRDGKSANEQVEIVEKWSKEHPVETRQSEFFKQFPKAPCMDSGVLKLYPCQLGYRCVCDSSGYNYVMDGGECSPKVCMGCRENFWKMPIKQRRGE